MNIYDERVKTANFQDHTTYQNDYKKYCEQTRQHYNYERAKFDVPKKPSAKAVFADHESFAEWKDVKISFDLFLYPKPIVGTNPNDPFKKLATLPTVNKEHAIKTRPRLYMTPACSMDDIPDPEMRKMLIQEMYTTEWRTYEREGARNFKHLEPCLSYVGRRDNIKFEVELQKPLDQSLLLKGKAWDEKQLRGDVDPTKEFWLHKNPPVKCGACVNPFENLVPEKSRQTIRSLIKENKLRIPHDIIKPGYSGFKPMFARSIPLNKIDLPTVHPLLSTSQAITNRYAEDLKK